VLINDIQARQKAARKHILYSHWMLLIGACALLLGFMLFLGLSPSWCGIPRIGITNLDRWGIG